VLTSRSWTKLLPKSGDKFDAVIEHMRSVGIEAMANRYSDLCRRVIDSRLKSLISASRNTGLGHDSPLNLTWVDTPSQSISARDANFLDDTAVFDEFTNISAGGKSGLLHGMTSS
jgi:hypothetical protein